MAFILYLFFIFFGIVAAIIQYPANAFYLFSIIFITYFIGVYSGLMLAYYHEQIAKYTNTYKEDDEIRNFYLTTGFTPVMNVILSLFYFLNLKEIKHFEQMKAQGSFYIPKSRRDALNRMDQ